MVTYQKYEDFCEQLCRGKHDFSQAAGLTPPQRKIVKRAVVTDDPDDDDEAIELLLNLLS